MDTLSYKIKFFTYLYQTNNLSLPSKNMIIRIWKMIVSNIIYIICKFDDPVVFIPLGQKNLYMNVSHQSPIFKAHYPYYDTAIVRICKFLKEKQGYLTMIDVGANIGDTVALITDDVNGNFLCIEAEEKYFHLLLVNTKNIPNVVCSKSLMSDSCDRINFTLLARGGSAHISESISVDNNCPTNTTTVDSLLERYPQFLRANMVKVDTDGYDYKVIRGCEKLIERAQPVFLFELHPGFLINVGKEDPTSLFGNLLKWGYSSVLVYDNTGILLATIDMGNAKLLAQLVNYALLKGPGYYFDVIVFHQSLEELAGEFVKQEETFFHQ